MIVLVKLQARDGVKLGRLRDSFKASRCADCAAKVIGKAGPHEKVGVIMLRDSKVNVVEYSEIGPYITSV